jgi:hypothetical protein
MALVEEELQAHSFRIIFATSETMVFRKRDLLGVVSGEMFGHWEKLYGSKLLWRIAWDKT